MIKFFLRFAFLNAYIFGNITKELATISITATQISDIPINSAFLE
jgi:hypothetical protein